MVKVIFELMLKYGGPLLAILLELGYGFLSSMADKAMDFIVVYAQKLGVNAKSELAAAGL
jgi:hypothetical protein